MGMKGEAMNGLLNSAFGVEFVAAGCRLPAEATFFMFRLSISDGMAILRRFLSFILLPIAWPESELDSTGDVLDVAAVELISGAIGS